jgi:hypothetical protein
MKEKPIKKSPNTVGLWISECSYNYYKFIFDKTQIERYLIVYRLLDLRKGFDNCMFIDPEWGCPDEE